jgi:hypothetical protein
MRDLVAHTITSFWKPEPEEAKAIAAGGLVMLTIHGLAHPMVAIGACAPENPPQDAEDPYAREAAKAAIHTLQRALERSELKFALREQDFDTIRSIITKGGTAADVLKFLDTPTA